MDATRSPASGGLGPGSQRARRALVWLAYLCVAIVLLMHGHALSRNAVDVPYADDWRQLRPGAHLLPVRLDPSWLLIPANRTIYATGKLLDYLFFTFTSGSYARYQQISFPLVLGGCLLSAAVLLRRLRLPLPWHLLGILSMVYLLQVRSYWGISSLAYHQALPVLGVLLVLLLLTSGRRSAARTALLFAVAIASGFAYVSGAVATFSLGAYAVAAGYWLARRARVPGVLPGAWIVLAAGAFSLGVQLACVPKLYGAGARFATPSDWQFWHFGLHQIAKAFGISSTGPGSVLAGGVIGVAAVGVVAAAVARAAARAGDEADPRPDATFVVAAGGVLVAVASYLAVVSYGRAALHLGATPGELAVVAKARFHYWWVTALVPWVAVAPWFARRDRSAPTGRRAWALPVAVGCLLIAMQSAAPWSFDAYYGEMAARQREGVECLIRAYRRPGPIHCRQLMGMRDENVRPHIENARARSLSFTRRFD